MNNNLMLEQRRNGEWGMGNSDHRPCSTFHIPHSPFAPAKYRARNCRRRPAVALLLCLFVLSLVSVWVVGMFQSATVYQSALRNTIEYEQALYLANAGVHHAVAELETDVNWRGTVSTGSYPASGSYSATAVNGATAGTVDITATGVSGDATRRLQATALVN